MWCNIVKQDMKIYEIYRNAEEFLRFFYAVVEVLLVIAQVKEHLNKSCQRIQEWHIQCQPHSQLHCWQGLQMLAYERTCPWFHLSRLLNEDNIMFKYQKYAPLSAKTGFFFQCIRLPPINEVFTQNVATSSDGFFRKNPSEILACLTCLLFRQRFVRML